MINIRPLSRELQMKAKEELNEVTERIADDLDHIRDWLKKQPHLVTRTDDQWLVSVLRGCKFSLEKTKEKLDTYYTVKTVIPEFFRNRVPFSTALEKILKSGCFVQLPLKTSGPIICVARAGVCKVEDFVVEDIIHFCLMVYDILLQVDDAVVVAGIIVIYDDQWLLTFLRGCKFSLEKTKEKLDTYYTVRTFIPEIFCNRAPFSAALERILKAGCVVKLPKTLLGSSPIICLARSSVCNVEHFSLLDIICYCFMVYDILVRDDDDAIVSGVQLMVDLSNLPLRYALQATPTLLKNILICLQRAYPLRVKAILLINAPPIFDRIYSIAKQFMNPKLKSRVFVYDADHTEEMYSVIPKEVMPIEYGGNNTSIDIVADEFRKKFESYREWFLEEEKYRSYEVARPRTSNYVTNLIGMEGSFRKLEVD